MLRTVMILRVLLFLLCAALCSKADAQTTSADTPVSGTVNVTTPGLITINFGFNCNNNTTYASGLPLDGVPSPYGSIHQSLLPVLLTVTDPSNNTVAYASFTGVPGDQIASGSIAARTIGISAEGTSLTLSGSGGGCGYNVGSPNGSQANSMSGGIPNFTAQAGGPTQNGSISGSVTNSLDISSVPYAGYGGQANFECDYIGTLVFYASLPGTYTVVGSAYNMSGTINQPDGMAAQFLDITDMYISSIIAPTNSLPIGTISVNAGQSGAQGVVLNWTVKGT